MKALKVCCLCLSVVTTISMLHFSLSRWPEDMKIFLTSSSFTIHGSGARISFYNALNFLFGITSPAYRRWGSTRRLGTDYNFSQVWTTSFSLWRHTFCSPPTCCCQTSRALQRGEAGDFTTSYKMSGAGHWRNSLSSGPPSSVVLLFTFLLLFLFTTARSLTTQCNKYREDDLAAKSSRHDCRPPWEAPGGRWE